MNRYIRQTILPEIGEEGQKRLNEARILCVGGGGLGCPALLYLTAAGVGQIGVVDFDVVDKTNLHRQILYTEADIGQNKATAAKARMQALNSDIRIVAYPERLTPENIYDICSDYDLIIDGSDNFSTKFLINDFCVKYQKPFVHASVLGFEGQISVFDKREEHNTCYRCLFAHPPKEHTPNCNEAGVIGAAAGIIGTLQAAEAIKLVIGNKKFKPMIDMMLTLDIRNMKTRHIHLSRDKRCPVCTRKRENIEIKDPAYDVVEGHEVCSINEEIPEVTAQDAKGMDGAVFVDVREGEEWDQGHIDGALHLPLSALLDGRVTPQDIGLNSDQQLILYCRSGQRSEHAGKFLKGHGFNKVHNLVGGILAWAA